MLDAAPALTPTRVRLASNPVRWPDCLRFEWRDLGLVLTVAAATATINTAGAVRFLIELSLFQQAELAGRVFFEASILYAAMIVGLKAAERIPMSGWRRHLVTVATGMAVKGAVDGPVQFLGWPYTSAGLDFGIASSPLALFLFGLWSNAAMALIMRAWLIKSREENQASKMLSGLRAEQVSARRRLVEGRLKAIQARVDPEFFFDMLESVQKMYAIDSSRAEQLLDELTTFLRAALPRLRTASSTVEQECDLARSFARLRALAGRGQSRLEVDIAPAVGAASFPPGVLLPLIDELLRATADADSVAIACLTNEPIRLSVTVQLTAAAQPSTDTLAVARATLLDLFGAAATLTNAAIAGGSRTTVEVPYELANA